MSSCSSVFSSRTIEERTMAAQIAAEAMLSGGTDSETSSARNGTYGSINTRPTPLYIPSTDHLTSTERLPSYPAGYPVYISDDVISGTRASGDRMSPVRRFFCLFVTFDVLFTGLLWIITVIVTGRDIKEALHQQTIEYTIYSSLFDIVVLAILRFLILMLLYSVCNLSHVWPVALTTSATSAFLIAKVFLYEWTKLGPITFEVTLVLVSFILAWGETWHLDFRVLPLELKALEIAGLNGSGDCERAPLLGHRPGSMLQRYVGGQSQYEGSVANYFSPMESPEVSDDEGGEDTFSLGVKIPRLYRKKKFYNEKDYEYKRIVEDYAAAAIEILEKQNWKFEKKVQDDIVESMVIRKKKLFKLTGFLKIPAAALVQELFYHADIAPTWNPTLKECRTLQIIDSQTDVTHQICSDVGGGISSRDFVNVRQWSFHSDMYIIAIGAASHTAMPEQSKYVRGENGPSCFAISSCDADPSATKFVWILNVDLKGWIPQGVIDQTLTGVQFEYLKFLRKRVEDINFA